MKNMEPAKSFEELVAWQKAHQLTLEIYRLTKSFPKEELYGLTSQIKRAATSVPSNIAEGFQRRGKADKCKFFNIAQASLEEARYQLILARDLDYADTSTAMKLADETGKLLGSYMRSVENSSS